MCWHNEGVQGEQHILYMNEALCIRYIMNLQPIRCANLSLNIFISHSFT